MQWVRVSHLKWKSDDFNGLCLRACVTKSGKAKASVCTLPSNKLLKEFKGIHALDVMTEAETFAKDLMDRIERITGSVHIPSAKLVVHHNGKEALVLNKRMLDRQNCWENLELIKQLHKERLTLEDKMNLTDDTNRLVIYDYEYTDIEFRLQDAWGFPRDKNFHRFWNRPKCRCPHLDNEDRYPHGPYVYTGDCPIHGEWK